VAKWRGTTIHRVIEQLCKTADYPATQQAIDSIQQQLKTDALFHKPAFSEYLDDCIEEAVSTFNHADFSAIFKPASDTQTYNEMPLLFQQNDQGVYGIIDRVLKSANEITIIDYKSHQLNENENAQDVASQFASQLDYYRSGVGKLWPGLKIKTGILFTNWKEIVWLEEKF